MNKDEKFALVACTVFLVLGLTMCILMRIEHGPLMFQEYAVLFILSPFLWIYRFLQMLQTIRF